MAFEVVEYTRRVLLGAKKVILFDVNNIAISCAKRQTQQMEVLNKKQKDLKRDNDFAQYPPLLVYFAQPINNGQVLGLPQKSYQVDELVSIVREWWHDESDDYIWIHCWNRGGQVEKDALDAVMLYIRSNGNGLIPHYVIVSNDKFGNEDNIGEKNVAGAFANLHLIIQPSHTIKERSVMKDDDLRAFLLDNVQEKQPVSHDDKVVKNVAEARRQITFIRHAFKGTTMITE
jgi:hypothetical protein